MQHPACACVHVTLHAHLLVWTNTCISMGLLCVIACKWLTASWLMEWTYWQQICHNKGSGFWSSWYGLLNSLFLLCCLCLLNNSAAETLCVLSVMATELSACCCHTGTETWNVCKGVNTGCRHLGCNLKHMGNHSPNDTVSHPRRTASSSFIILYCD